MSETRRAQAAVDALVRQQRVTQITVSKAAGRRILNAYLGVQADIDAQLQRLQRQISAAQASGEPVHISWLYQANRLSALQQQVGQTVERFTSEAQALTRQMMQTGAQSGADDAHYALQTQISVQLADAGLEQYTPLITSSFNRLHGAALEDAANNAFRYNRASTTGGGNRVRAVSRLYQSLPTEMQQRAKRTLIYAVAVGQHPSVTARALAQQMGIARNRALMIARTEQLNAYRRANVATFRANSDVCDGWIWLAATDACPFCASMNGTRHSLDEVLDSHPNCRCTQSPIAKPLSDILAAYGLAA